MKEERPDKIHYYNGKKVMVAGGTGTIGIPLVALLKQSGANVEVVSLDSEERARAALPSGVAFRRLDLTSYQNCCDAVSDTDIVVNLAAIKGNSQKGMKSAAEAFMFFIRCNTNLMDAAYKRGITRYLYVSSICAYPNIAVREEDQLWNGPPQANDRYTGIAKRTGEAQAEVFYEQYGWDAVRIARPSNVYGPFDDFNPLTAQVIPSLIAKFNDKSSDEVIISGDGSAQRDFIYADDVARGLLQTLAFAPANCPINLGSGKGESIKEIAKIINDLLVRRKKIVWNIEAPTGDTIRVLSTKRAKEIIGFEPQINLQSGIKRTLAWFQKNKDRALSRGFELHGVPTIESN
jgi:GDP-L-fucose synthase